MNKSSSGDRALHEQGLKMEQKKRQRFLNAGTV